MGKPVFLGDHGLKFKNFNVMAMESKLGDIAITDLFNGMQEGSLKVNHIAHLFWTALKGMDKDMTLEEAADIMDKYSLYDVLDKLTDAMEQYMDPEGKAEKNGLAAVTKK